jgi:GntR family transcriptional regulator, transcriptional repressor for pyruvate dehydrogenase complex
VSTRPTDRGQAVPRRSISEDVADRIRVYMQTEELSPGDRLGREEDLAREFGVSRPTLREALRVLSSAHLIRASKGPGGGIFVAATPEQGIGLSVSESVASMLEAHSIDVDELIETRLLLEVPLAGLAAQRADDRDLEELEGLLAELDAIKGDLEHVEDIDARVHRLVADIAGNRLAAAFTDWIVDVLQPRLREMIAPAVVEPVIAEQHRDLIQAIRRGDPSAAERAMREHLVYLGDLVTALSPENEPHPDDAS